MSWKLRGIEALSKEYWPTFKTETTVVVRAQSGEKRNCENRTTYGNLSRVRSRYDTPIIKYKAKMDDEMKLTKENVGKILDEWFTENTHLSAEGIIANIEDLDDTSEKVPVPKCFDDWYKEIEAKYQRPSDTKKFALWKLCQKGFGYGFERVDGEKICYKSELGKWLLKNTFLAIDAVLYGYTIEPEKLYYIPLPDLETSDGLQQVLSKRKNDKRYFASRPNDKLQQRYTKEEIAQVPEVYKPFAKPIEGEEE
ncbi:DUF1642 domain-containing protein [Jeotgalibaca porci]|uniref:DUF1642 domain-containing protein n=1 Tax=Jeotgalibaca porci TaxID=1868793 RepID=UPI0035A114FF